MESSAYFFETQALLFLRFLLKRFRRSRSLHRSFSNAHASQFKLQRFSSLGQSRTDLSDQTLIFSVEGALLKSSSLFPYFMLVAFEAGSLLRALLLFLLYPLVCLVGREMGLKIMVMACFFGLKAESFRVGSAVLPKFLLEDVGLEGFEVVRRGGRKVGVTDMPQVMVECFLRDYMEIECVVGRDLKVVCGYFVGVMEDTKRNALEEMILKDEKTSPCNVIGLTSSSSSKSLDHQWLSLCKEIYLVSKGDKRSWHHLPRARYPKPLIFHDGRLVFRPTPLAMIAVFLWIPFGFSLAILRAVIALTLPYNVVTPLLTFTGIKLLIVNPNNFHSPAPPKGNNNQPKGRLYVCNHRTLLDPLYISFGLRQPVSAVTYSLSRVSELLSPIRTVRLTRTRDQDSKIMERLLNQGNLAVFPEGTTCREPYLLRFSPLFSEMSDDIVPVAFDSQVTMFYGTSASGFKCLDPLFFLMNPSPTYTVHFLDKVCGASNSTTENSRFGVANHVQSQLAKALGFECSKLTRKDKYLILAGNEGIVASTSTDQKH